MNVLAFCVAPHLPRPATCSPFASRPGSAPLRHKRGPRGLLRRECTRATMSLRPAERAHGPAAGKRLSRVLATGTPHGGAPAGESAMDEALGMPDIVTSILEAIAASDPESACKSATNWCAAKSGIRRECTPAMWETLTDIVFPNTARLREILARVRNADPHKVFVGLCNTKPILRALYANQVYFDLSSQLSYMSERGYVDEDVERLRIFDAFKEAAHKWLDSAERDLVNLQWEDPHRAPYYRVLDSVEPPLWRIRNLVNTNLNDAISRAVDYGRGLNAQNARKFVFGVSIEDKKKAMEALIDTCVEEVLNLLETHPDLSNGNRPPEVVDPLKEKLCAPFTSAVEGLSRRALAA